MPFKLFLRFPWLISFPVISLLIYAHSLPSYAVLRVMGLACAPHMRPSMRRYIPGDSPRSFFSRKENPNTNCDLYRPYADAIYLPMIKLQAGAEHWSHGGDEVRNVRRLALFPTPFLSCAGHESFRRWPLSISPDAMLTTGRRSIEAGHARPAVPHHRLSSPTNPVRVPPRRKSCGIQTRTFASPDGRRRPRQVRLQEASPPPSDPL